MAGSHVSGPWYVAGVPTMGMSGLPATTGNVWFVDSVSGSNAFSGAADSPFATVDYAIGRCTANNGDVIVVAAGHAETLATASAITSDVAGVTIIGLGEGASRPTFTFSATASTWVISAASTAIYNIVGVPSIDSVVSPFVVSGANCTLFVEWQDASASVEAVRAILTTADANNLTVDLVYKGFTGGNAVVNAVRLVGCDNGRINVDFYGIASTAVVEFLTTACTNIEVTGTFYVSGITNLSRNVVDTVGGSTWGVQGWDAAAGTDFSGGSAAAVAGDDVAAVVANQAVPSADATANALERDVVGNKTDAAVTTVAATKSLMAYLKGAINWLTVGGVDAVANASAADVIGNKTDASVYVPGTTNSLAAYAKGTANLQERVAFKSAATMVNAQTMFTVAGGPIQIIALASVCATGNDGTASTLQYNITPTSGSAQTISGASASLASATAGASVTLAGTALATAALYNANGPNLIANPGTIFCPAGTINMVVAVGSTTGTWAHYLRYKPLAAGVTVT